MASDYNLFQATSSWSEDWDSEQSHWYYSKEPNVTISDKIGAIAYEPRTTGWFDFDVTDQIRGFVDGSEENNGFILRCAVKGTIQSSGNQSGFYSSEYLDDMSLRPKLEIEYRGEGVATMEKTCTPTFSIGKSEHCSVTVLNVSGRVVKRFKQMQYDSILSNCKRLFLNGVYFLQIESEKGVFETKNLIF